MKKAKQLACIVMTAAFGLGFGVPRLAAAADHGRYQVISVSTNGAFSSECLDEGARALTIKVNDALSKGATPLGGVSVAVNTTTNTCSHEQAVLWPAGQN